jgi:hypothetical protein
MSYVSGNFPNISDKNALGKFVTEEYQKIENAATLAAQQLAADEANIAANTAAIAAIEAAWTSYTPVVISGSGTLTTVSATGSYQTIGKTVLFQITITITTNGTGSSYIDATLPVNSSAKNFTFAGAVFGGGMCKGVVTGASTPGHVFIGKYDNTYPGASGAVIALSGSYESA